jgi:hypothetical protein
VTQPVTKPCEVHSENTVELPQLPFESSPEDQMPLSYFAENAGDWATARARMATALFHGSYMDVFVGEIVGEYPQWMREEEEDGGREVIMSWCQIKVLRVFRGHLKEGEQVNLLYAGGVIAPGVQWWPPHALKCAPFDIQMIGTNERDGVARPAPWDGPWEHHHLVEVTTQVREAGIAALG